MERELKGKMTKNQWAEVASAAEDGIACGQRPYSLILYLKKNKQMMLMTIIPLAVRC